MKKLTLGILFSLACVCAVFLGCGKKNVDKSPGISFVNGAGYVASDVQLTAKDTFRVGITASSSTTSGAELVKFTVVRVFHSAVTVLDSIINAKSFGPWTGTFIANSNVGSEEWRFFVTDADGETASKIMTIQTTERPIATYTDIKADAQLPSTHTVGSILDLTAGVVFPSSTATYDDSPAVNVQALYFNGSGNATIGSLDDSETGDVFNTFRNSFRSDTIKLVYYDLQNLRFKDLSSGMSTGAFDAVADNAGIADAVGTPLAVKVANLAVNSIIGFKTSDDVYGLLKVTDLVPGDSGSITYTVKVQQ
ncbi:MAG: hypothetical protein H6585_10755 [Flavobacteriales bacterium]|nr:hypothetical protein [Flavobacteriales bacterium]MCB9448812.1 hypothetical protein [Flavobacteriales bacterium]